MAAGLILAGCGEGLLGDSIDDLVRNGINDDGGSGVALSWDAEQSPDLAISTEGIASFGRNYDDVDTDYSIQREGDRADAEVLRTASGELEVVLDDGSTYNKSISNDVASRNVVARENAGGKWNLDQVSIYEGRSEDGETEIVRVTVMWGDHTVVFDDLDALHDVGVLTFAPGEEITVTVEANDSDVVGVIHQLTADVTPLSQRLLDPVNATELRNVYNAPDEAGRYFTYVDLFDHEAITDETSPYSAAAWGMPYHVEP
ncbi:MAG: hypothetical protein CME06_07860 [Gemmatimonadetes bacterium]|nr:hypothetical protein [Gemmatimonadota bacterium]